MRKTSDKRSGELLARFGSRAVDPVVEWSMYGVLTYGKRSKKYTEPVWVHGLASHLVSAVVGLRSEEREEGVVLPPREGVGVRDGRPLSDLELAEGTELLMPCRIALERQQATLYGVVRSGCFTLGLLPWIQKVKPRPSHHVHYFTSA